MVASRWRLRRAWAIEARMLEKQIAAQTAAGDLDRYQRAMHNLLLLRVIELPNEPSPISGQSAKSPLTALDHGLPSPDAAAADFAPDANGLQPLQDCRSE